MSDRPACPHCKGAGIVYRYLADAYGPPALHPRVCICRFPWGQPRDTVAREGREDTDHG